MTPPPGAADALQEAGRRCQVDAGGAEGRAARVRKFRVGIGVRAVKRVRPDSREPQGDEEAPGGVRVARTQQHPTTYNRGIFLYLTNHDFPRTQSDPGVSRVRFHLQFGCWFVF